MMKSKFITLLYVLPILTTPVSAYSQTTSQTGKSPDRSLKIKSSGVPTFDLVERKKGKNGKVELSKTKNIPKLNLGQERVVKAENFPALRFPANSDVRLTPLKKNPELPVYKWQAKPLEPQNAGPKDIVNLDQIKAVPSVGVLPAEPDIKVKEAKPDLANVEDITPNDFKYLQALIFLDKHKKFELAMGLFSELMETKTHKDLAYFQYARTAFGLGMMSEFRHYMLQMVQETKRMDKKERAVNMLVDNIQHLQITDIGLIDPLVEKFNIDITKKPAYLVRKAQFYLDKGDLTNAEQALLLVDEKADVYPRSRLLSAFLSYRKGNINDGLAALDDVLDKTSRKDEMRSLAALTKGRFLFQQSKFKEAYDSYLQVDKSSPHWLPAMTEVAWTQIMAEDYEGAAGNMFSLHTDFFKNAFAPETYIVRTVGYLNLCQYGDSLQVLNEMKKRYGPLKGLLDTYASTHKKNDAYYETIKTWAANPSQKSVDGLPRAFIVEVARHPSFISTQKEINALEDEAQKISNINIKLAQIEKELRIEQQKISSKKYSSEAAREEAMSAIKLQAEVAQKARNSIKKVRTDAFARIDTEKTKLRNFASSFLKERFDMLNKAVAKVVEQNDVLAYEIYSGAGEHIRYQMAGGEVSDKERAQLKAQDDKALNWKFKGEIWEDEIGHYRSSLKNVCPSDQVAATQ
ncbi:MAG: tetratricopeptide repeat protein [Bdellovibrionia bacterium]